MATGVFLCAACLGPRNGISRVKDKSRKNALCSACFHIESTCECGCGRAFPAFNGHGIRRRFYSPTCHLRVPEIAEQARARRSAVMEALWQTEEYRMARADPDRYAKGSPAKRARGREWLRMHPDRMAAHARSYRKRYPERRAAQERRRNLKKRVVSTLTRHEWQAILERYGHRCAYCGGTDLKLQQDHVIPISKGGHHTAENVVPACFPCNRKKWDKIVPHPQPFS